MTLLEETRETGKGFLYKTVDKWGLVRWLSRLETNLTPNFILETHMVEGVNQLLQVVLWPSYMYCGMRSFLSFRSQ